jgi:hypothetical protein
MGRPHLVARMRITTQGQAHSRRRVYRTNGTVLAAIAVSIGCLICIPLAVLPNKAQPVGYVFAPLLFVFAWRAWRLGAYVEPEAVRVVNPFGTRRIAWGDIDQFAARPAGNYPYVGQVIHKAGRPLLIFAICPAGPGAEKQRLEAQVPVDGLNEALEDWRHANGGMAGSHDERTLP